MPKNQSFFPEFSGFLRKYDSKISQVVYTNLIADLETPVSAMLKITNNSRYSFLLESVEGGSVRGRYSIIGMEPDIIWKCHQNSPEINRNAISDLHLRYHLIK